MTMHRMVNGVAVQLSPEEEAATLAEWATAEAEKPRRAIIAQISNIEASITPRRLRDAVLGTDSGWLAVREAEIAALRAQL